MKTFRLPYNARMKTKFNYRPVSQPFTPPYDRGPQECVFDGVENWLEFTMSRRDFMQAIQEIDISSSNRFYSYDQSDIPWLTYCYPERVTYRSPEPHEIVEIRIDNITYKAVLQNIDLNYDHLQQELSMKAILLRPVE